ncbi:uncharacterized protein LOC113385448 [Ctenocephalides felis]|uniref:uncharacterized protein LOC113385421 n=1 Tax=Ctenocephalides felis TaxID=7515 RepID=UPI000E6E2272|nr:uncharacterized protein LOC113385421 [Ctenocephalides felis]XP_026479085.1 uncharacterized protein LOC113385448 [Ctenocephalides felis]
MWKFIQFTIFFSVLRFGASLECYSCELAKNSNCTVPLAGTLPVCNKARPYSRNKIFHSFLKDNSTYDLDELEKNKEEESFRCLLVTGERVFNHGFIEKGVIRECVPARVTCEEIKKDLTNKGARDLNCTMCDTDLCNGSLDLRSSFGMTISLLIIILIYFRK